MRRGSRGPLRFFLLTLCSAVSLVCATGCLSLERKFIYPGAATQGRAAIGPDPSYELVSIPLHGGIKCAAQFGRALGRDGSLLKNPETRPTILFFYGNGMCLANSGPEFDALRKLGANVLIPEYPGYGMSEGQPSEARIYELAEAAYVYVCQRTDVDARRVVACGWSLGAASAVHLASRHDMRGLITISGFTTMREVGRRMVPWLPLSWFLRPQFDNLARMPNVSCPVLIVHGERDDLVPPDMAQRLAEAARTRARVFPVPGAGHNDVFSMGGRELWDTLRAFVDPPPGPR